MLSWTRCLSLVRSSWTCFCNPKFTFLHLIPFDQKVILQPRLGLRAALEEKQRWRGRALCQQVDKGVLVLGVCRGCSSAPTLAAGGLQGAGGQQESVKETPDFAVSLSSACKQLSKVVNVCRFQWDFGQAKAGKLQE